MQLSSRSIVARITGAAMVLALAATAPGADPPPRLMLHLTDGSFVGGAFQRSEDAQTLRWKSPSFTRLMEFPWSAVKSIDDANAAPSARPAGEYCFELAGDDFLYGDLLGLTGDDFEVQTPAGRVHVQRDRVRRLFRSKGADAIYLGPSGLTGWKDLSTKPRWRDEGGHLFTDQPGATLFADLGIPDQAAIEFEVSWKSRPDFTLAIGVDEHLETSKRGFRIEVVDNELVVIGESARDADIAVIQPADPKGGNARVYIFLDQKQRRLFALSRSGKPLAALNIADKKPTVHSGVRLTNGKGDVRLEFLRISRWNGISPRDVEDGQSRLMRPDGSAIYGNLADYDPTTKRFTFRTGDTTTVVGQDDVADMYFTQPHKPDDAAAQSLRVVYRDGSRFSGTLVRIEDDHLTLLCGGVREPLQLPLAGIRSVLSFQAGKANSATNPAGRKGRLEMDGVNLRGRLENDDDKSETGRLTWRPDLAVTSSAIAPGSAGRILYRERQSPAPPAPPRAGELLRRGAVAPAAVAPAIVAGAITTSLPTPPKRRTRHQKSMHLRTGDTIPCEVLRIDEKGVTFKSPQATTTFVPHDKIKCVELVDSQGEPELDEAKRERLLTLPRMQRDSPPTHFIFSKNGDCLRGRIVDMDDSRLIVEVRLENKQIPRDRVTQIIWLHADELNDQKAAAQPAGDGGATRVQALGADGHRLTFVLAKCDGTTVSGASDVLGECRANLADIDELLFGSQIERSAAQLAFHTWRLHHAIEPKFVQADAGGDSASTGLESALVGQPAPTFHLDLLDGATYRLADHKGRIVVLDFWATWCGPCLQYMPQVDAVAKEFADRGVELVAVNMEEQPDAVKSMLERHKLTMPVILDRDGAVAAKYAVTAIPQTVVIDREGKVARLFVGGGKGTAESLRKALQELTAK